MGRLVIGPFLWNKSIRAIDAAVLTHPDEDHLGGLLFVLNNFKVGCVIDNGLAKFDSDVYRDYLRTIHEKGIRRVRAREGDKIQGFDGVELYVLNPPEEEGDLDSNESSLVIKAVFGDTSILLTGDIGEHAMKFLIGKNISLESDVLKVPHHGGKIGKGDTARRFFALVRPKASIISVSRRNRFRAPSKETVDIITDLKSNIYETRECGAIDVTSDGEHAAARRFCDLTRRDEKN
jgi:competence protein ComEC